MDVFAPTSTLPPHRRGEETQRTAAKRTAKRAPNIRERVFEFIAARKDFGATIAEISDVLGIRESTVCGRVAELQGKYGYMVRIKDSGHRRKTPSGSPAKVWVATYGRDR